MAKEILAREPVSRLNQFPDLSQFADPEPFQCRAAQISLRTDLDKVTKSFTVSLSPDLAQSDLCMAFVKGNCTLGRKETVRLSRVYWILGVNCLPRDIVASS